MRHNLKELTVLVVAGLLVLATGTAVAQETTGALAGSVSDEYGTPIAGATIQAEGAYGRITSVTDETGQYRFPRLTPGAYTVTAQLEGYAESSAEVTTTPQPTPPTGACPIPASMAGSRCC